VDKSLVEKISKQVARKFPEVSGVRPAIQKQRSPGGDVEQYLLTYKAQSCLPDGRKISRIVRVVADERGRVLKMSTSK
jgi:hypothetical protein